MQSLGTHRGRRDQQAPSAGAPGSIIIRKDAGEQKRMIAVSSTTPTQSNAAEALHLSVGRKRHLNDA
jgi:hypothetical protein